MKSVISTTESGIGTMGSATGPSGLTEKVEVLREGARCMDKSSRTDCLNKEKGGMEQWAKDFDVVEKSTLSCDWYHGTWQYLRLLNMVAVPDWYPFYKEALKKVLRERPEGRIMISACADYGMLAKLHEAMQEVDCNPSIVIYDICHTPLKSADWFARKYAIPIDAYICDDIIFGNLPKHTFDLIVTDEFLSVLKDELKPLIMERWANLLNQGGYLVTTAMQGVVTTPEGRERYAQRARKRVAENGHLFPYHAENGGLEQLMLQTDKFAALHTRHMIRDRDQLVGMFNNFDLLQLELVETPGECVNPTWSYQIMARYPKARYPKE